MLRECYKILNANLFLNIPIVQSLLYINNNEYGNFKAVTNIARLFTQLKIEQSSIFVFYFNPYFVLLLILICL